MVGAIDLGAKEEFSVWWSVPRTLSEKLSDRYFERVGELYQRGDSQILLAAFDRPGEGPSESALVSKVFL